MSDELAILEEEMQIPEKSLQSNEKIIIGLIAKTDTNRKSESLVWRVEPLDEGGLATEAQRREEAVEVVALVEYFHLFLHLMGRIGS